MTDFIKRTFKSISRIVRARLPSIADNLDQLARIEQHKFQVREKRHKELDGVLETLTGIVREAHADDAVSKETLETLLAATETVKDLATLSLGEHVDLFDPEVLARGLVDTPTDRQKIAFRMMGYAECDRLIALIREVWPESKVS